MDFSCHTIFPKNPPIQKVTLWKNKTTYTEYFFVGSDYNEQVKEHCKNLEEGNSYDDTILKEAFGQSFSKISNASHPRIIFEPLFQDDTIRTLLFKIMHYLKTEISKEKMIPYIWSDNGPLRFRFIKNPWKSYHPNPFYCSTKDIPTIPEVQQLPDKIVSFKEVHIATYTDILAYLTKTQQLKYFFPNEKDTFKDSEIQSNMYEQQLLTKLWYTPDSIHKSMIQQSTCTYLRAIFSAKLDMTNVSYKQLFEKIHASNLLPFIQFYDDMNHIYYKVYKEHKIPETYFTEWTNMASFTNQHSLTLYSFLKEDSMSFVKVYIDENGIANISYRLESNENVSYEKIQHHLEKLTKEMYRLWNINIKPSIERLALKTTMTVKDVELKPLSAVFAKLLPIFHVPSKNRVAKNILDMQFKRVPKYGQTKNIYEFIKSKIELEVPIFDIIMELQEYGVDEEEVRELFEQIQRQGELPQEKKGKRDFKNLGLLMHINPIALGLQIYIDNASNFTEMQSALFWTRAAVAYWMSSSMTKKKLVLPIKEKTPPVVDEEDIIAVPIARTISPLSPLSTESEPLSFGGAVGKKYQRFFKKLLEDADPDIFAKTENYARKCQVTDLRQPIVMSKEQKAKIDAMGYSDGYDDFVEYGSDGNHENVYMCPKIYCPDEQIPLSYEKYIANGEKCPNPNDEPILLYTTNYWYNDPARKHYVGFLGEKGYNDLKLPCCFKLPKLDKQKSKTTKKTKVSVKDKEDIKEKIIEKEIAPVSSRITEETYIIDKPKKLDIGRYGTIPSSLHEFLYEGVPYNLCKNTVKGNECLLRRGISNQKDSLLESIAYLLDFENKEKLVQHIYQELDPFTFLTLENGKVYSYFLNKTPILPEENYEKRKELKTWLAKHSSYVTQFQLEDILGYLTEKDISTVPVHIRYRIARQLMIYDSYYKYLQYLKSEELKNPYLLFDLIHFLGALLVVWNRDSQSIATIRCPFSTKNKRWFMGQKELPYVLVMQQENYYEPLVIVHADTSKSITQKIGFTHFDKLFTLLGSCPAMLQQEDDIVHRLYTLSIWIETILSNSKEFRIYSLVLDPQDRAIGCFLWNDLYIAFQKPLSMFSLKNVIELCDIPYILYHEDIQFKSYDVKVSIHDFRLLKSKLEKLGFGFQLGTIKELTNTTVTALYTVPAVIYPEPPKLPILLKDTFIQLSDVINHDNRVWYKIKKTLLEKLTKDFNTLIKPLLKLPRKEQLQQLVDHFKYVQQPSKVAVLLEELPITRKDLLTKIYEEHLLEKPYYYKDNRVFEGYRKKEWIFTQKAVQQMDISFIKNPTRIQRPQNEPLPEKETITNVKLSSIPSLPTLLQVDKLEHSNIPSKWRTQFWSNYSIGMLKDYTKNTLFEVIEWIAKQKGIYLDTQDLRFYLRKEVFIMLEKPELYELILEDLSMRKAWNKVLGRQYRTVKETIELGFASKEIGQLQELWKEVSNLPDLWVQDLDLFNISKLVQISFLILQKGKDIQSTRGNIEELVASSKFISALPKAQWLYQPVLVLFKSKSADKSHYEYGVVFSKDTNGFYSQGLLLPSEMQKIIEKHVQ